ncbi:ABC transporter substrate-binding protein [Vibrio tapetis subsp. quintayensis]|uniref:substrate-binding periplasmic protein n=1 Tax=Vibrio tapetis TaxID=52443 RepID=UPI0025B34688|nr:ABC transporter substrate-binding protein [Vibrio tapetis]MDN3678841.1 ABC transporter substrate-binding protein [Vibrio tapetis subsp. quintayensis]
MLGGNWKAIFLLLVITSYPCSGAKTIQVLTYEAPPFAVKHGDAITGLLVEIVHEMFSRTNINYELKFVPLKRALLSVERNDTQCIIPLARSQEREAKYQWISPVLVSRFGLFAHPDDDIKIETMEDAKHYVVGSYRGAGISDYLTSHGFTVETSSTNQQSFWKLQKKRVGLWASELINAEHYMLNDQMMLKPKLVFYTSLSGLACNLDISKNKILQLKLAMVSMHRDGFITNLYQKYGLNL